MAHATAKPPYHHGRLAEALIAAGVALLEERGAGALSLRAAARRAGVSHAAPYRHFRDRDALLAAVAAEGFRRLDAALARAAAADEDEAPALAEAYVAFALDHPGLYRLMFGPCVAGREDDPVLAAAAAAAYGRLAAAGARRLAGRPEAPPPGLFALAAWSLVHGLASLLLDGRLGERPGGVGRGEVVRRVAALLAPAPAVPLLAPSDGGPR